MGIRIKYARYGHKGDPINDGVILLHYIDHAILHALFDLLVNRGINFAIMTEAEDKPLEPLLG